MRALLFLLTFLSSAIGAETIRLANGEWAPYLSPKLPGYGPVSALVSAAFAEEGITVEYVFMPWRRGYEEARDGRLDGTIVWSHTVERARDFLYSDSVGSLRTMLFYRKGSDFDWRGINDLAGLRIGGVIGYSYAVEQAEQDGRIEIERIADPANNYRKLMAGRLDLVAEDQAVGQALIDSLGLSDAIVFHPRPLKDVSYHVLISRHSGRGDAVLAAFNRGLAKLRTQGRVKDFLTEHHTAGNEQGEGARP